MFKIEKINEEKTVRTIRIGKELNQKIETEAKKNNVSVSKFITLAVMYAIDHMEKE